MDFTRKEMFLIEAAIHLYSGADNKWNEMRDSDEVFEIMSNKNELISIESVDDILESYKLLPIDLECKNYGIYDKQLNQFKDSWYGFKNKIELKEVFENYIKEVLIDGSAIENGEWDNDDILWELFEYEIRPYEN